MNTTKNIEGNGKLKSAFFLHEDFLLQSDAAKNLYHNYAADLPIIDYHNHLPANEIAENKKFTNLTEIWLKGDHYKWRAMRTLGVNEKFITGDANDLEKFKAWAACVPQTVRNPLFHWTHMELRNPFGINEYLDAGTGNKIYTICNELLTGDSFSTRGLLQHFNVEMACTTDDPCDALTHHKKIASDAFKIQVLPGFRPDKILNIADR
jgi:glucuronate isomerase